MRRLVSNLGYACMLLALVFASAEITARVEDQLRYGMPFANTPDFDYDLFITADNGSRQGKPHGLHKKWRLNSFGFRSAEVQLERTPSKRRVMLLGSSETFGVYESPGKDYPAQLATLLNLHGNYEVINTSLPGMTLKSAAQAYEERFAKFLPDVVVVYVSPLFYLNLVTKPTEQSAPRNKSTASLPVPKFQWRIVDKLKDNINKPEFWQRHINEHALAERRASLGPNAVFTAFPQMQLDMFADDLATLVDRICEHGSKPLLVTHAIRAATPPSSTDLAELQSFLIHTPRATPEIVLAFEAAAREKMLAIGKEKRVQVIDLAQQLNGRKEAFGDMVHFTDAGAATTARLIAESLVDVFDSAMAAE